MKIKLLLTGKTGKNYIATGIDEYTKRIQHYIGFESVELDNSKLTGNEVAGIKKSEGKIQLKNIDPGDFVILLDEKGKAFTSIEYSGFIQQKMNESRKCIVFVIGGAYGFSDEMYGRANFLLSLSKMTFNHQMVRIILVEQIYRAFSIIHNEPYHHS